MIGKTFGHYEIIEPLGEGGMGKVYRARDTKLDRDVAIKVLPEDFATDRERIARFEREAKLLASLNHTNIAAIYGLEDFDDQRFIAMELVEGDTLADRIAASGQIEIDEALAIASRIAEALEAAHESGVIHRDLKPANVMVAPDGKVKVLDFGLAKAFEVEGVGEGDQTRSPMITVDATKTGVIQGTAAYMSPEQAKGRRLDKRTDIFSFGCVLYEMLTGRRPFVGEDVSETMAAILREEPDWTVLPATMPFAAQGVLRRCLRKDPDRRLHDIADARIEIEDALRGPAEGLYPGAPGPAAIPGRASGWRHPAAWGLAALAFVAGAFVAWWVGPSDAPVDSAVSRWTFALPAGQQLPAYGASPVAISGDGTMLAYTAHTGGRTQIYVRPMGELEPRAIPGTEGAESPFFSPDGQWIGFFADGKLKKVSLIGGSPVILCDAAYSTRGSSWGAEDTIYFADGWDAGLKAVSADGGDPEVVTNPDSESGEINHGWPHALPSGSVLLFTVATAEASYIAALNVQSGDWSRVIQGTSKAQYSRSGHLLFAQSGRLNAVPFDPTTGRVNGSPAAVLEGVYTPREGIAHFAASPTGSLVYVSGDVAPSENRLVWVDREGEATPLTEPQEMLRAPILSPDGTKVTVSVGTDLGTAGVWIFDLERGTRTRLTERAPNAFLQWMPDGQRVVFSVTDPPGQHLYRAQADGSAPPERLLERGSIVPLSFSADGKTLLFYELHPQTRRDLWKLDMETLDASPVLVTANNERLPMLSPDGRWLAYVSDETGRAEVYVRPYPGLETKWAVSTDGGDTPIWSGDGRELFYRLGNRFYAVDVQTDPEFAPGIPRLLFERPYDADVRRLPNYDVSPDGERFLMIQSPEVSGATGLNVVLNWFEELERLVPTGAVER